MKFTPKNVDDYIASQPENRQATLQKLRELIKTTAPDAAEVISYSMPAYKYHGMLAGFAAAKDHYGLYPWNSSTVDQFKEELQSYSTSKGTICFPTGKPLPVALIKKIVKARMKENLEKIKK